MFRWLRNIRTPPFQRARNFCCLNCLMILVKYQNDSSMCRVSPSQMAKIQQKHWECTNNSVLEASDHVRLFMQSVKWSYAIQEIHAIGSTTSVVSRRDRSTSKVACVRMFRRLRNIHTRFLKVLKISAVRSPERDSWNFLIALMREESIFRYDKYYAKYLRAFQ